LSSVFACPQSGFPRRSPDPLATRPTPAISRQQGGFTPLRSRAAELVV